jgi:hypothetical protein
MNARDRNYFRVCMRWTGWFALFAFGYTIGNLGHCGPGPAVLYGVVTACEAALLAAVISGFICFGLAQATPMASRMQPFRILRPNFLLVGLVLLFVGFIVGILTVSALHAGCG